MNEKPMARLEENLREMEELLGEVDAHFGAYELAAAEARVGLHEAQPKQGPR